MSRPVSVAPFSWHEFSVLFLEKFVPQTRREELRKQFEQLCQECMFVTQYEMRFSELARHTVWLVPTKRGRIRRFIGGLNYQLRFVMIRDSVSGARFDEVVDIARRLELVLSQVCEEREAKRPRGLGGFSGVPSRGQSSLSTLPAQSSSRAPSVQGSSTPLGDFIFEGPTDGWEGVSVIFGLCGGFGVDTPTIDSVPVVRHFLDVFLVDLMGIPPDRDIDFGYYHRFVEGCSSIAAPLTKLTQKGAPFRYRKDVQGLEASLLVEEDEEGYSGVKLIQDRLRTVQSRQKNYTYRKVRDVAYMVGEKVLLKVSPVKGIMRFGKKGKLSPRYIGPFEVLQKIGEVAYEHALPPSLLSAHLVFHVSMLRKYVSNPPHVLDFNTVQLDGDLIYDVELVDILDRQIKFFVPVDSCSTLKKFYDLTFLSFALGSAPNDRYKSHGGFQDILLRCHVQ
ncbi:uncharacterized protein [Nicotiana tomentosiformis]|uniref:uncharacterized protein n=1 Tax=Nicotiana tomentosiformis TaxID=4098 RepID=UPI00388C3F33